MRADASCSFPSQVLGKTAKSLPVLLWGALVNGRTYKVNDLVTALIVFAGCATFLLQDNVGFSCVHEYAHEVQSSSRTPQYDTPLGIVMMTLYLMFDGMTSTQQERLFAKNPSMSSFHQMFYANAFSLLASLVGAFSFFLFRAVSRVLYACSAVCDSRLARGSSVSCAASFSVGSKLAAFAWRCARSSFSLFDCQGSLAARVTRAQSVQEYGAFTLSLLMTTRQVFSMILSCMIYSHTLTGFSFVFSSFADRLQVMQYASALVVFAVLYSKLFVQVHTTSKREKV